MRGLCIVLALAGLALRVRGDEKLMEFGPGLDAARIPAQDAEVSLSGDSLRIDTFHKDPWPGIRLVAPKGMWDLSRLDHIAIDVKNVGVNSVTVCCRVDNSGADGVKNCITESINLKAGDSGTLKVAFVRKGRPDAPKLFGMRGYPPGIGDGPGTIDPAKVTQLVVFVPNPQADHSFAIANIRASGSYTPPTQPPDGKSFLPFIDTFGQYMHADWPGKVHSLAELKGRVEEEARDLAAKPGPEDWDAYGGWKAGPTLKAAGFFRTEKYEGKWWLVDPDGRLFWSHGIDCVGALNLTPIEERDAWFADFPGRQSEFAQFIRPDQFALHGHYAGNRVKCFGFAGANLKRKYGDDWLQASAEIAHKRLRSWGMNTIANWSDARVWKLRRTPYTATIHFGGKLLEGSQGYWGKFRDVFDPDFGTLIQQAMQREAGNTAGDPCCLGFFVNNEIAWGDDVSLAMAALASPAQQPAKKTFIGDLRNKYGAIEKLNEAWGTAHASWDALLESRTPPDKKKAADDLAAFYTRTAETYFKTIRDAVKRVAPNQLYLGCRFAWTNDRAATAAAKFCDVVSYNLYRRSVADFKFPGGADVPLIIGEFHFGALDRGMFHTGLVKTASQAERGDVQGLCRRLSQARPVRGLPLVRVSG